MFNLDVSFKRILKNFAANVFGQGMSAFYQIVSIPLFLHYWSTQMYGEWIVMFTIPSLLWSLEGGLAAVASNRMTVASASGNWEFVNVIYQNVLFAQGVLAVLLMSLTLLVTSTVDLQHYFKFTQISATNTSIILVLLMIYMLSGFYMSLFRAAYRASEMEARGIMANNFWKLTDFGVCVLVLVTHHHPLFFAVTSTGVAFLWAFLIYADVRRTCPRVEFGIGRATWHQTKQIMVDGFPLLAGQAGTAFFLQGYPLVINQVLGAPAVVAFATVRTVTRMIIQLIWIISGSSGPEVARSYGRQDWQTYLRLLKIILASALWGGVATLLLLSTLGPWVIELWTSGKVTMGHFPLFLFSISIALQGLWGVGSGILVCSNMHHLFNYLYLGITLCALLLARLALPVWGFEAVPGVMVIQDAVLMIIVVMLCRSKLSHITFSDLYPVFTFDFYWSKIRSLLNRSRA